jgi:hypothetical protein
MIKSVHIVGIRGGKGPKGHKIKAIEQMTNTWIKFRGRGDDPRIIKISSRSTLKYFADQFVMQAKTLIMKSLLGFLADPSSERRLVYEMGLAAAGTLKIHKVDDTVQEICHQTEKFVWMKVLELPHNEMYSKRNVSTFSSFLLSDNLQQELTSKTSCCIEVYGLIKEPSMLCTPYVFIHGIDAGEVNDVAAKVACLIKQHLQKCHVGLQSQNDNVDVDSSRVLVRNLSSEISPQDLHQAFGRFGDVRDIYIPQDYHTQQPKRFAFIEYATPEMAREAREEMDKFLIKGQELEVVYAQEKRKTPNDMRGRVVDGKFEVGKKILIPTDFDYKASIIGPNGKTHQELVALCGGGMNIQIKMRGGDSNSTRRGSTDEPLHVILNGTRASVDKAEKLIMELLDTEKARFLDTLANRKRKSLLGTDSLSEHSIEYPRKSCKVMGKTITLTIPLWVMKTGNDLNGKYVTFLILMTIA